MFPGKRENGASSSQLPEDDYDDFDQKNTNARDYLLCATSPSSASHHGHNHHDHHDHSHDHYHGHHLYHLTFCGLKRPSTGETLESLEDAETASMAGSRIASDQTSTTDAPKRERPRSKTMEQLMTISEGQEERAVELEEESERVVKD